jgi:hyperosmotically inducible protein
MTRKLFVIGMMVIVCSYLACKTNDDAKITADIKTKFTDDGRLDAANINVNTKEGVVTLNGKVLGHEEENRAIEIARSVPGVTNVVSELEVETQVGNSEIEERVEENEEVATDKREEAQGHESIGDAVDDVSITSKVKLAFAKDPKIRAYRIDVDTKKGVVTLTGTVKDSAEAKRAISVAKSVKGVKSVNSVLTIGS